MEKINQFYEVAPSKIEEKSFEIISEELLQRGISVPLENAFIVKRAIHTTADFDYAQNMYFSPSVVKQALSLFTRGRPQILTDTNMALSGISKAAAQKLGIDLYCFMADSDVAQKAQALGITRAAASVEKAVDFFKDSGRPLVFAVGNAPTALIQIHRLKKEGLLNPALVIAVPVGFVNVEAAKNLIKESDIPCIAAMGRKGGSTVAAAIVNALLYECTRSKN